MFPIQFKNLFIIHSSGIKINREYRDDFIEYLVWCGLNNNKLQEIDVAFRELESVYIKYFNFRLDKFMSDICDIIRK